MRNLLYLGPSDLPIIDQGSAYKSKEMKKTVEAFGVSLEEARIETPGAIRVVESYHAPLRMAYRQIGDNSGRQTIEKEFVRLAVLAVNCTVGPAGLCPALLVFGATSRPARSIPAPTQL